jgi:hypothetical protein
MPCGWQDVSKGKTSQPAQVLKTLRNVVVQSCLVDPDVALLLILCCVAVCRSVWLCSCSAWFVVVEVEA